MTSGRSVAETFTQSRWVRSLTEPSRSSTKTERSTASWEHDTRPAGRGRPSPDDRMDVAPASLPNRHDGQQQAVERLDQGVPEAGEDGC